MKRLLILLAISIVIFIACQDDVIHGNKDLLKKDLGLANFHQISVIGSIDVDVTVGEERPWGTLEMESNLMPYIEVKNNTGLLTIRIKKGAYIESNLPIKVTLGTPKLHYMRRRGPSDIKIRGLKAGNFQIYSEGSGDSTLSGKLETFIVKRIGSGDVHAEELSAEEGDVDNIGYGDVYLGRIKLLTIKNSGSGDIRAWDQSEVVKKKLKGSGSLKFESR